MITRDEFNQKNDADRSSCDSCDPRVPCEAAEIVLEVGEREPAFDATTHVRMLQRRHDRMRWLLEEVFFLTTFRENRQELAATGSTGKALLHEVDGLKAIFDRLGH